MHNSLNGFADNAEAHHKIRNRKACHCGIFQRSRLGKCLIDNVARNKENARDYNFGPKFLFVYLAAVLMVVSAAAAVVAAMVVMVLVIMSATTFVVMMVLVIVMIMLMFVLCAH